MSGWEIDPGKTYADANVRADLLRRCSSERTRSVSPSRDRPCKWNPGNVRKPGEIVAFRPDEAWEFAAEMLRQGIPIEIIELDHPPGKRGYVIKPFGHAGEVLYIKFEFGASGVFGRSFHVSDHQPKS